MINLRDGFASDVVKREEDLWLAHVRHSVRTLLPHVFAGTDLRVYLGKIDGTYSDQDMCITKYGMCKNMQQS